MFSVVTVAVASRARNDVVQRQSGIVRDVNRDWPTASIAMLW